MYVVLSQAWTLDAVGHADAYVDGSRAFHAMFGGHPGFRGRRLLRGSEDPTHFIHLRYFDSIADYQQVIQTPGYADHIASMSEHLRRTDGYPREYLQVVLDDPDPRG